MYLKLGKMNADLDPWGKINADQDPQPWYLPNKQRCEAGAFSQRRPVLVLFFVSGAEPSRRCCDTVPSSAPTVLLDGKSKFYRNNCKSFWHFWSNHIFILVSNFYVLQAVMRFLLYLITFIEPNLAPDMYLGSPERYWYHRKHNSVSQRCLQDHCYCTLIYFINNTLKLFFH